MTYVDRHPAGTFSWIELATTNQHAAHDFYSKMFGWAVSTMPMPPDAYYTAFTLEGRPVAAAYQLRPDQKEHGVPAHWRLYVEVEKADAAVARTVELGGSVIVPAGDVGEFGRMAVLKDPQGALFSVWESHAGCGTGIAGIDGTLCWADLSTPDPAGASRFYAGLFGWQMMEDKDDPTPSGYVHIKNGEDFIGGIPPAQMRNPNMPAHWLPYFVATDCDGMATKAKELGAQFYLPPTTFEDVGRMAVLADPQGAVFAIFQTARK
jgi:predicted enzyme related to lactoylglutathione lyase